MYISTFDYPQFLNIHDENTRIIVDNFGSKET